MNARDKTNLPFLSSAHQSTNILYRPLHNASHTQGADQEGVLALQDLRRTHTCHTPLNSDRLASSTASQIPRDQSRSQGLSPPQRLPCLQVGVPPPCASYSEQFVIIKIIAALTAPGRRLCVLPRVQKDQTVLSAESLAPAASKLGRE